MKAGDKMEKDNATLTEKYNRIKNLLIVETVSTLVKEVEDAKNSGVADMLLDSDMFLLYINNKVGENLRKKIKESHMTDTQEDFLTKWIEERESSKKSR